MSKQLNNRKKVHSIFHKHSGPERSPGSNKVLRVINGANGKTEGPKAHLRILEVHYKK